MTSTRSQLLMLALVGVLTLGGLGSILAGVMLSSEPAPVTPAPSPVPTREIPSVAATPAPDAPSSTQVARGVAELADPAWVARIARAGRIPERALTAYAGAAIAVRASHPGCGLGWNTLAAIGLVESEHGTIGGSAIGADGIAAPPIIGVALDGKGVAAIRDTDRGELDGDTTWDRAVGPLQFIPATWAAAARDGNLDGVADVPNIDDAALAAAVHLCEVGGDLTVGENWIAAIAAYNDDPAYNNRVADAAGHYARLKE